MAGVARFMVQVPQGVSTMTVDLPARSVLRSAFLLATLALALSACHSADPGNDARARHGTDLPIPLPQPTQPQPSRPLPPPQARPQPEELREVPRDEAAAGTVASPMVQDKVMRSAQVPMARYVPGIVVGEPMPMQLPPEERERYLALRDNGVVAAAAQPYSTFSVDVDTGSYSNVRRFLNDGQLPPPDAVRVEEMINYFPYQYAEPRQVAGMRAPFGVTTEVATSPWNADALLVRIGIKAFDQARATLPASNLVFLVDVSGSMDEPAKLPLLKNALRLMVDGLRAEDHVSLVTYASGTRVVLPPTSGRDKAAIRQAIDQLVAGGSTAGAAGIQLAYQMARQGYIQDGINRILLATDGDFNVGITDFSQLKGMVAEKRKGGISLSTLGFGAGNYNEEMMEQVADAGDGNYSYIDTLSEAQKVLVEEASSTLSIVARDVKVQMEFNPAVVAEYRLIGYENRALAREDFRNDKVDAGEVGAGHAVTALYEVVPVGKPGLLGESRYGAAGAPHAMPGHEDELGVLRLRYKTPAGAVAPEVAVTVHRAATPAGDASEDLRFAAAVAAFGQQLRGGKYLGSFGYPQIEALASGARGSDRFGYRGEFLRLVKLADALGTHAPERYSRTD
jgi:Ca-activated chloride channel family protein